MRARPGDSAMSLVFFTVFVQAASGVAVVATFSPDRVLTLTALVAVVLGGLAATFHLGRWRNARFALANLGNSWLSREGALTFAFGAALAASATSPETRLIGTLAALVGVTATGAISMVYLVRTIPPWNTWMTPVSFFLTAAGLGAALSAKSVSASWNGLTLVHLAAAAIVAQVLLGLIHHLRFGSPPSRWLALVLQAAGVAVLLIAPIGEAQIGVWAVLLGELVNRHTFFASHRRVGL